MAGKWFGPANWADVVTSLIERGVTWWIVLTTVLGGGAVTGIAAYYSNWQPIHIAGAALGGAVALAFIYLLVGLARVRFSRARVMQKIADDADTINPLSETFEKKRIRMSDFYTPYRYIYQNRTFIDCEFMGPGVVLLVGNIDLRNVIGCDFVEVPNTFSAANVTIFTKVTLRRCSFYNATIIAPKSVADQIKKTKLKINWITDPAPPPGAKPNPQPGAPSDIQSLSDTPEKKLQ